MEAIVTQFSPDDRVWWRRKKGRTLMKSAHKVQEVHIVVMKKGGIVQGAMSFFSGIGCALTSRFTKDPMKKEEYMDKAKEHFSAVEYAPKTTKAEIKYKLDGEKRLVPESELRARK